MKNTDAEQLVEMVLARFGPRGHVSIKTAARLLDCSEKFLRAHSAELFPHSWRLMGQIRIPMKDIDAMPAARRAVFSNP